MGYNLPTGINVVYWGYNPLIRNFNELQVEFWRHLETFDSNPEKVKRMGRGE